MGRESRDRRCGQRRGGYRRTAADRARGIAENDRQFVCRGLRSFGSGKRSYKARRKSSWGSKKYENSSEILHALESKAPPISLRTYYARREEAIELLSSVLWGYIPIE